jgi:hypothetical protein
MAKEKSTKERLISNLVASLADDTSGVTIATQRLYEAFDSFSVSDRMARLNAPKVAARLHEVWVQVMQAFARVI